MIFNPYNMFKKGYIIKGSKECLAQNGYDLRVDDIFEATTDLDSVLTINDKELKNNAYVIVKPNYDKDKNLYYFLKRNTPYIVTTIESVYIPKNAVGIIFSRSTFNRNGIIVRGTLFDSGFKGQPSLAIYPFLNVKIAKETRIAQIIFVEAKAYKLYNGKYQENEK